MTLQDLRNTPFRLSVLEAVFPENKAIAGKAKRLEDSGKIIRLKKGMYVVAPSVSGNRVNEFLIANHLNGPSYVSMQTALRYYGLIPENVYETTSVTSGLSKSYTNSIGTFSYVHCSGDYFPIGIRTVSEDNTTFLIASPEKALCDMIIFTPNLNLRYLSETRTYLESDLRIDLEDLKDFDLDIIRQCAENGKKETTINQLIKIIENERNI